MQVGKAAGGRVVATMVAIGSTALLAACGSSSDDSGSASTSTSASGAPKQTAVRIAIVNGFGTLPIEAAKEKGFFAKNGLKATVISATDQSTFAPALGRQYDIVLGTPMDTFAAASRGIPLKVIATTQRNTVKAPNNAIVTKDAAIKSVADLKGKRLGVVGLAGTSYASATYLIRQAGVDPKDVKFVPTPFPNMGDQLKAGRLDATISTSPFIEGLMKEGYREVVDAPLKAFGEGSPNTIFYTSPKFLQEHPDVAKQFRQAISDATADIEADPAAAKQLLETWLKLPPAVTKLANLPYFGSSTITVADLEPMVKVIKSSGLVPGKIPAVDGIVAP